MLTARHGQNVLRFYLQSCPRQKNLLAAFLGMSVALYGSVVIADDSDPVSFNRDISPLLSENCFACHGPDKEQVAGGFRLDDRQSAISEADSGEIPIIPGKASESEIMWRLKSDDESLRMPPPESGKTLTPKQIAQIGRWIDQGAAFEQHWAFVPPRRVAVPQTEHPRPSNPIDHFIFDALSQSGLSPAEEADRETLLRRVSFDLTGLPPTPAQVQDFINDATSNAYEKAVDRLLMSPHYGERMALPWLDKARYADSNGFQSDGSREMWAWRDWVIDAYNRNLPFDQFTIEQLAGDMLADATRDQIVATGFNRNHRLNGEGGRIVEEWFVETVIDRVETTGLTWLGLTFNCCRCHDHKYDPISQREFYQMFSYFNSGDESGVLAANGKKGNNTPPLLDLPTAEQTKRLQELDAAIAAAKRQVDEARQQIPSELAAWEAERQTADESDQGVWIAAQPTSVKSLGGATLTRQSDGSYLASGTNPAHEVYEMSIPLPGRKLSGVMLEALPDPSLPTASLGRSFNGNFVLTAIEATITADALPDPQPLDFAVAAADFEQPSYPASAVQRTLSNKPAGTAKNRPGWAIAGNEPQNRVPRHIMFVLDKTIELPPDAVLNLVLRHDSQFAQHTIGRFGLFTSERGPEELSLEQGGLPAQIVSILQTSLADRTDAQAKQLTDFFLANVPNSVREAEKAVEQAQQAHAKELAGVTATMVMKEGKRRDAFILQRGEYDKPTEKVERQLPAFLPPLPEGAPNDRLGLAQWIADESNPLTARVWVNRQWEQFFGIGIVKTSENFGTQAEYPSHPELLDWLAVEFMNPTVMPAVDGTPAQPWDMKAFHKMLVMSATYRQSSHVTPQLLEQDPDNRLLARGPRFRLTGEWIRDAALAASGLLVPEIGGPSVRPYMPAGVWDETSKYGNLRNYKADSGDGLYRRTMYTIWKRTAAPPTMLLFDAPNREVCTIQRSRTNTPLQALSLLNEITFVEASRGLAMRMLKEGGPEPSNRVAHGFQLAIGRQPTETELTILTEGLQSDLERFAEDPAAAEKLTAVGALPQPEALDPQTLAAYTLTANVILNLDEFVTRE